MPIDSNTLLKRLEPIVRPVSMTGPIASGRSPLEAQGFDELLHLVSKGEVSSGAPVRVSDLIDPPLDDEQRSRLAAAADLAQAAGSRRALALLDGRGLVLDVADRTVTQELAAGVSAVTVNLDAAIFVAGEDDVIAGVVPPPGGGFVPPAIAGQIQQQEFSQPAPGAARSDGELSDRRRAAG